MEDESSDLLATRRHTSLLEPMDPLRDSDSENETYKGKIKGKKSSKLRKENHHAKDVSSKTGKDSSKSAPSFSSDQLTLWDLAIKAAIVTQDKENQSAEKSILFVGSKNSGKTTMVMRFLDRDETLKPTIALEYTFGRRTKSNNLDKDIVHIWELGGGTWLSKLTEMVISADTVRNMTVAIVLDLSKPSELWLTLERWLDVLRTRVLSALNDIKESAARQRLEQEAWKRIGEDHDDRDLLDPFLIPIVIIGSKYEVFQEFEPEPRKVICKTLRFIAHRNGAHLLFVSAKQEALVTRMRAVINHLGFATLLRTLLCKRGFEAINNAGIGFPLNAGTTGTSMALYSKSSLTDHNKPLFVTAGQDSLQQIGSPPLQEGDLGRISVKTPMDLWKHAFITKFPQQNTADPAHVEDPAKDKQFAEPVVDTMKIQKDEELERYRRACERNAREAITKSIISY